MAMNVFNCIYQIISFVFLYPLLSVRVYNYILTSKVIKTLLVVPAAIRMNRYTNKKKHLLQNAFLNIYSK
ncbi:hypothetical protein BOQ62_21445 [Chryseobacterium sp. CH21]|nr:hypothetical protein BOQ62_21445 [Chryseobacterium sp. CH21]